MYLNEKTTISKSRVKDVQYNQCPHVFQEGRYLGREIREFHISKSSHNRPLAGGYLGKHWSAFRMPGVTLWYVYNMYKYTLRCVRGDISKNNPTLASLRIGYSDDYMSIDISWQKIPCNKLHMYKRLCIVIIWKYWHVRCKCTSKKINHLVVDYTLRVQIVILNVYNRLTTTPGT